MEDLDEQIQRCVGDSSRREELLPALVNAFDVHEMAEVGVYRGRLAEILLRACPGIHVYHMIDPWRHLPRWNKPANRDDSQFARIHEEAMSRTAFAADRRAVHRGTTLEVADEIPDASLDLAYIDGDHTLRGITIDLISMYPKVRSGGWIAGDDFSPSIWQHAERYEPTLVYPYAIHFAEATGARLFALPDEQFLMHKGHRPDFAFVDLTGRYPEPELRMQLVTPDPRPSRARGRLRALRARLRLPR